MVRHEGNGGNVTQQPHNITEESITAVHKTNKRKTGWENKREDVRRCTTPKILHN